MMLVPCYLAPSGIHGIGVFAAADIARGAKVWEFTPGLDQVIEDAMLEALPSAQADFIRMYSYVEARTGERILCCDHARHFNFSPQPNTGYRSGPTHDFSSYALLDIRKGEELTYSTAEDLDAGRKLAP